jgi:hypothetical protein
MNVDPACGHRILGSLAASQELLVRIDKAQHLGPQELPDARSAFNKANRPAGPAAAGEVDGANLDLKTAGLLQQAADVPAVDLDAVERARQLLKSGQLDTPEACLRAARNILDRGI